jgi:hypothetical protein
MPEVRTSRVGDYKSVRQGAVVALDGARQGADLYRLQGNSVRKHFPFRRRAPCEKGRALNHDRQRTHERRRGMDTRTGTTRPCRRSRPKRIAMPSLCSSRTLILPSSGMPAATLGGWTRPMTRRCPRTPPGSVTGTTMEFGFGSPSRTRGNSTQGRPIPSTCVPVLQRQGAGNCCRSPPGLESRTRSVSRHGAVGVHSA